MIPVAAVALFVLGTVIVALVQTFQRTIPTPIKTDPPKIEITTTTISRTTKQTTSSTTVSTTSGTTLSKEEQRAITYGKSSYADVARDPQAYTGKLIQISGKVSQFVAGDNPFFVLCDNQRNQWIITMDQPERNRILEGDQVTFYGRCIGLSKMETIFGEVKEIPTLDGWEFKIESPAN